MRKHKVAVLKYDDDSGTYYGCTECGLFMGIMHGTMSGKDYSHLDEIHSKDGECPGKPVGEVIVRGFRKFWISPGYGGNITNSIRRLYGGSGHLSSAEKVTQKKFEAEYGPCLAMRVTENGDLEAVTEKYIVAVGEYDGNEYLEATERTPDWFRELE